MRRIILRWQTHAQYLSRLWIDCARRKFHRMQFCLGVHTANQSMDAALDKCFSSGEKNARSSQWKFREIVFARKTFQFSDAQNTTFQTIINYLLNYQITSAGVCAIHSRCWAERKFDKKQIHTTYVMAHEMKCLSWNQSNSGHCNAAQCDRSLIKFIVQEREWYVCLWSHPTEIIADLIQFKNEYLHVIEWN